jgi:hypothetical protein
MLFDFAALGKSPFVGRKAFLGLRIRGDRKNRSFRGEAEERFNASNAGRFAFEQGFPCVAVPVAERLSSALDRPRLQGRTGH